MILSARSIVWAPGVIIELSFDIAYLFEMAAYAVFSLVIEVYVEMLKWLRWSSRIFWWARMGFYFGQFPKSEDYFGSFDKIQGVLKRDDCFLYYAERNFGFFERGIWMAKVFIDLFSSNDDLYQGLKMP